MYNIGLLINTNTNTNTNIIQIVGDSIYHRYYEFSEIRDQYKRLYNCPYGEGDKERIKMLRDSLSAKINNIKPSLEVNSLLNLIDKFKLNISNVNLTLIGEDYTVTAIAIEMIVKWWSEREDSPHIASFNPSSDIIRGLQRDDFDKFISCIPHLQKRIVEINPKFIDVTGARNSVIPFITLSLPFGIFCHTEAEDDYVISSGRTWDNKKRYGQSVVKLTS